MPWYVPSTDLTITTGEQLTAAKLNKIRDDLADLDRRTTITGATVTTNQTSASTSYVDLATAGPAVTVTIGSTGKALVSLYAQISNDTAGALVWMSYAVSGATTVAAADASSLLFTVYAINAATRMTATFLHTGLTAGSNTFTMKYRTGSGTGAWADRKILVTPLGS